MTEGTVKSKEETAEPSLMAKTINGFLWAFTGAGFQAILRIIVLAILARLLKPSEFGVVSAAMTVVALADLFGRIGVAPSLVQAPSLDEAKIRTASTITVISGLFSGMILFLAAPLVADLYQIPKVEPVIRAFSVIFVISGFAIVPQALLQREMRFRVTALVELGSYIFGYTLVGITLAFAGLGIWALVWAQVAQLILASVAFIALVRPQMRPMLDRSSLRHLFHFGAGVTLSRFGNYVALNADYFMVGRWLGADALGFYSRAYVLLVQPVQLIGTVGEKVLYPALAAVQNEERQLLRGYYRSVALIAMATIPLTGVLIVLAPELIRILLGSQWGSAVLPFQILLLSLVFRTAYKVVGTLLRSRGSVYLLAGWQWVYAALVAIGTLSGLPWGIVGVSTGVTAAIVVSYVLGALVTKLCAPTSMRVHSMIFVRYAVVAVSILVPVYYLRELLASAGLYDMLVVAACSALAGIIFLGEFLWLKQLFGEEGAWIRSISAGPIKRLRRRLTS